MVPRYGPKYHGFDLLVFRMHSNRFHGVVVTTIFYINIWQVIFHHRTLTWLLQFLFFSTATPKLQYQYRHNYFVHNVDFLAVYKYFSRQVYCTWKFPLSLRGIILGITRKGIALGLAANVEWISLMCETASRSSVINLCYELQFCHIWFTHNTVCVLR